VDPWTASYHEAMQTIAFAYLITALLFARSGLYADRAQRPGLPKIVSSLFQTTVVALIFALVNGEEYSSYYIFYGTLFFAIVFVGSFRWVYELVTGVLLRAAGYRRRAVLVGHGQAHRGRRPRAGRRGARAGGDARLHLAAAPARQRACARSGASTSSAR
jgi:FlaA1/EpsC-like NDP-sugar epimerase